MRVSLIKKDLRLLIRQQQDVTARCLLPSAHLLADGMHGHAVSSHRLSRISARRALTKGSHAFAGRLPCPPVPWRREPGDLVLGLTTHLHVLAVAVCSQIAHAIHRCVRCTNQRARCSCVCVCMCVYVRVCMCVCVCVYEAHRDESSANHDPRPTSSVFSNAAPVTGGGGRGAGGLAQYPISSISRCMVWSGLVSPRGRRASRALCIPYEADRRTVIMRVTRLSGSGGLPRCAGGSEKGRADVRWSWMEEFHPHLPRHPGPQDDDIRPAQLMIALESRQGS